MTNRYPICYNVIVSKKKWRLVVLFDLIERFGKLDEGISLSVSYSNGVYCVEVMFGDVDIYSYSTTDKLELINKISNFYSCLLDNELFDRLVSDIETKPLEVASV